MSVSPVRLILTHDNADFDAVASMLAAHKLDPEAKPVLPKRVNRNVDRFLTLYASALPFIQRDDLKRGGVVKHVTVVDTQSFATARGMRPDTPLHFIDHHPLHRELADNQRFTGDTVGAATTLLVEQIIDRGIHIEPLEATLLMLGIYEDTGALTYGTTTPRDIQCAAWLMERGANLDVVRDFLQHRLSPEQRDLYDRLLEDNETHIVNGHVVVLACARSKQPVDEIATLAHKLRELFEPAAVFVLVQLDGDIQLVARGTTDAIDVSQIAKRFGGGGHGRAAAALIRDQKLHTIRQEILNTLPDIVAASVSVETLMSKGVQTVQADEQVKTVVERMQRTGHEGFPVIAEEGRLVGLLTRRAVDRAMSHNMGHKTVRQIMDAGYITVRPSDSIETLQQRMMRSGWGQIPVVDDDENLIGIVTRTDLIKQWGQEPDATRRDDIVRRMRESMSPGMWQLTKTIAREAQKHAVGLYVVGGFVRDLLLDTPNQDIDLVVEGDAIALVRAIRRVYGGDMHTHAQFGTAKWLLDDTVAANLGMDNPDWPESVDFVTARTEYYEQPTVLPTVQSSSIKLDLLRRDFTINTLAIRLSPEPWGELLDFHGGEQDLEEKIIRVLHSHSFIDDPTRMLRAVRLEQRLGFTIEPRSEELIRDALNLLDRVSGDRVRHELALILGETDPLRALERLEALGILHAIHPDLRVDDWFRAAFDTLQTARLHPPWPSLAHFENWMLTAFALFTARLPEGELETLGRRLQFSRTKLDHLHQGRVAISLLPDLSHEQLPSVIVRLLEGLDEVGWLAAWSCAPHGLAREQIARFACTWRFVKPTLDGRDLQAITGVKPGPLYGVWLGALRQAWLDGEITTPAEERDLLRRLVEEHYQPTNNSDPDDEDDVRNNRLEDA